MLTQSQKDKVLDVLLALVKDQSVDSLKVSESDITRPPLPSYSDITRNPSVTAFAAESAAITRPPL